MEMVATMHERLKLIINVQDSPVLDISEAMEVFKGQSLEMMEITLMEMDEIRPAK